MNPQPSQPPQPDMAKVHAALARYSKPRKGPPPPPRVAQDAALRKPLRGHSVTCRGFDYYHFHHRD